MSWDPITRIVGSLGIHTKIDFATRAVPLSASLATPDRSSERPTAPMLRRLQGVKVLVVEDELDTRELMKVPWGLRRRIVSRIFPENTVSLILHERCAFRVVDVYRRHGSLDGEGRDCIIVERLLD
jgi:hypothetical protein